METQSLISLQQTQSICIKIEYVLLETWKIEKMEGKQKSKVEIPLVDQLENKLHFAPKRHLRR